MTVRIIIACAGSQHKWNNHLGVPSHFVPLKRPTPEPLLQRTVRQALEYTEDVVITAPAGDQRYVDLADAIGVAVAHPTGANEYDSTRSLWSTTGRTVLLLGDVFFSDRAMRTIGRYSPERYRVFGRYQRSRITGTPYGEIFAASWWPAQHEAMERHLAIVAAARADGSCMRPAGWALLRSVQRTPLTRHTVKTEWFTEINDWTDDIDFPDDYNRHPATRG